MGTSSKINALLSLLGFITLSFFSEAPKLESYITKEEVLPKDVTFGVFPEQSVMDMPGELPGKKPALAGKSEKTKIFDVKGKTFKERAWNRAALYGGTSFGEKIKWLLINPGGEKIALDTLKKIFKSELLPVIKNSVGGKSSAGKNPTRLEVIKKIGPTLLEIYFLEGIPPGIMIGQLFREGAIDSQGNPSLRNNNPFNIKMLGGKKGHKWGKKKTLKYAKKTKFFKNGLLDKSRPFYRIYDDNPKHRDYFYKFRTLRNGFEAYAQTLKKEVYKRRRRKYTRKKGDAYFGKMKSIYEHELRKWCYGLGDRKLQTSKSHKDLHARPYASAKKYPYRVFIMAKTWGQVKFQKELKKIEKR